MAVPWPLLLIIVCGAGLPFFWLAGMGMRFTSVADGSTLVPGALPLFVSLLAFFFLGQKITPTGRNGLVLILIGVLLMIAFSVNQAAAGLWQGYALFLFGSLLWAAFTLALRRSGLEALEGAAVVTYGSIALLVIHLLFSGEPLQLLDLPVNVFATQILLQGIGVGLVSTISYAYAVAKLGANRASLVGALTPVCLYAHRHSILRRSAARKRDTWNGLDHRRYRINQPPLIHPPLKTVFIGDFRPLQHEWC